MSEAASSLLETGSRLIIDLSALKANYRILAERAVPAECAAVVKANAYGLGVERVAPALWEAGARTFFVAHTGEARVLRSVLPDAVIYVLNGLTPGAADVLGEINARPVLGSLPEIEEWAAFAKNASAPGAAVHVDTGMHRLGLTLDEASAVGERFRAGTLGFIPALVVTHLAVGDENDHALTRRQFEAFRAVADFFPGVPASIDNSAATLDSDEFKFALCRPGIALYGGNPAEGQPNPMNPVVTWEACIVQVRTVPTGETIGYGAAETAKRDLKLAVVSLGYADGFPRAAGSADGRPGAEAVVAGRRCPLVGRVSMDLIAVDVTDLPEGAVSRGGWATFIGQGISVDEVAAHAGTIGYEVLTGIGPRSVRIYLD